MRLSHILAFSAVMVVAVASGGRCLAAQGTAATARSSAARGKQLYGEYCAVCHGDDAKGDGTMASALTKAPSDLTTLASRNNGTFPEDKVTQYIQGSDQLKAHGSREMPVWGYAFRASTASDVAAKTRIANLVAYLKSVQAK